MFFRYFANMSFFHKIFNLKKVNVKNNEILFFNGYQSYHSAEESSEAVLRARLIFHIHNPHIDNYIDKYVHNRVQKHREKKL